MLGLLPDVYEIIILHITYTRPSLGGKNDNAFDVRPYFVANKDNRKRKETFYGNIWTQENN